MHYYTKQRILENLQFNVKDLWDCYDNPNKAAKYVTDFLNYLDENLLVDKETPIKETEEKE